MFNQYKRELEKRKQDNFFKSLGYRNDYVKRYNKASDKLLILSSYSQIRTELNFLTNKIESEINKLTKAIRNFVKVDDTDDYNIKKLAESIKSSLSSTFPYTLYVQSLFEVTQDKLFSYLTAYSEIKNELLVSNISDSVKIAFKKKEELENLMIHKHAIEATIESIFHSNIPDVLPEVTAEEIRNKNQGGRPSKIDDDLIKKHTLEMLKNATDGVDGYKRIFHKTPTRKGKPNYTEMARKFYKEGIIKEEELGDKALRDKIKIVVKKNWK